MEKTKVIIGTILALVVAIGLAYGLSKLATAEYKPPKESFRAVQNELGEYAVEAWSPHLREWYIKGSWHKDKNFIMCRLKWAIEDEIREQSARTPIPTEPCHDMQDDY